jgi:DNA helicase II / ATP-dependent DNA helicase PcrA
VAWSDGITGNALEIAKATHRRMRVMAGPGTGKSYAMQRRLMRLLEEGVNPDRILVVSFTRTAAAALVDDIGRLDTPGCNQIQAGTLHAYCFKLLAKRRVFEWTRRVPRTLVTYSDHGIQQFEVEPLLEDLKRAGEFGDKRERGRRIRANEAAWARAQSDEPGLPEGPTDIEFRNALLNWLRFHEAMLIGEVIPEALRFLRSNPASPEAGALDHVLVDEYQDLNRAEQVLLETLVGDDGSYAVFGDEDQSIYSFRYAHPAGIVEFNSGHPTAGDHCLDECRRCPKRVVAIADRLIRTNHPSGGGPRLNPKPSNPEGEVHVVQWNTLDDEAKGVAAFVQHLTTNKGYKPGDILVLCPRRLIGYGLRNELVRRRVPLHSFFHEEALEDDKAKRAFTLLTLVANKRDRVALRYWLGYGSPTCNARGYQELRRHCEGSGQAPVDALEALAAGTIIIPHTSPLVAKYRELNAELEALGGLGVGAVVDTVLPSSESESWAAALRFFALQGGLEGLTVASLVERLRERITQPELPEDSDCVRLMSLHKSKGLTSKVVIVAGCMQGLIPNLPPNLTPDDEAESLREQRRLFYVALTRCTEVLLLSSVVMVDSSLAHKIGAQLQGVTGQHAFPVASQFLDELGSTAPRAQRGDQFLRSVGL